MTTSIDQQIAQAEAKLSRLKKKAKANETRRKIIIGSVVITDALKDPNAARTLAILLRRTVTREIDKKEIVDLLSSLDAKASEL